MKRTLCLLGAGALALGLVSGSALASQVFTAGTQTVQVQLAYQGFVIPVMAVAPGAGGDTISNISIGRDDLSPFAQVAIVFGPNSPYYNGGPPGNVCHFTYRAFNDVWVPNILVTAIGTGIVTPVLSALQEQFVCCDIFARHAERMRANWGTTTQVPSQPYSLYLWSWAGFPVPNPLPAPVSPGWGMGTTVNEFYKYEIVY